MKNYYFIYLQMKTAKAQIRGKPSHLRLSRYAVSNEIQHPRLSLQCNNHGIHRTHLFSSSSPHAELLISVFIGVAAFVTLPNNRLDSGDPPERLLRLLNVDMFETLDEVDLRR